MSDSEDYDDSDAEEDLSNRSLEVTRSPSQDILLPLLECPVCFDLPLPPIRMCYQGHIICADCCTKLRVCPLCQKPIGIGRNFFAEDFLSKSIMRCKFHEDGCLVELPGCEIKGHVYQCCFRPIKCRECNRKFAFSEIDNHLLQEHGISKWDLNDEGSRILLCQKLRTRNPYGNYTGGSLSPKLLGSLIIGVILSIYADHLYFDSSFYDVCSEFVKVFYLS